MTKTITTVYVDADVLAQIKDLRINISQFVEAAFVAEIERRKGTSDAEKEVLEEVFKQQEKAVELMKKAQELEEVCASEDRELWNETYKILKEANKLPPINTPERVFVRVELFGELKAKKDAETKELIQ